MKAGFVRVIDGAAVAVLAFSVLWVLALVVRKAVVTWADPFQLPPPGDGWVLGLVIVLAVAIGGLAAGRAHPARSSLTTSVLTLVLVAGGVSAATLLYDTATGYHYLAATDKNIENTRERYGADWRDHAARLAAGEQACNWLADQRWGYPPDTPSADRFAGSLGNAPLAWAAYFTRYAEDENPPGARTQTQLWIALRAWKYLCLVTAGAHQIHFDG